MFGAYEIIAAWEHGISISDESVFDTSMRLYELLISNPERVGR